MEIGYRIIRPSDVGTQKVKFAQISLWRRADWGVADGERGVQEAIETARACRKAGIRTVYHPLEYPLTGESAPHTIDMMRKLADASDLGIIIHDEGANGGRLEGAEAVQYGVNVRAISRLCPISIENSYNSGDIVWFWERFVVPMPECVSVTLDIGHLEGAGIDSIAFIDRLPQAVVNRIEFVHIHHRDPEAQGVKDHRPLVPGCREMEALNLLLAKKPDVLVIVELDAAEEGMRESIELLMGMRSADFGMRNE
jgi:sugar phosphate isomerase/epimerase